jgi:hypothetical protein
MVLSQNFPKSCRSLTFPEISRYARVAQPSKGLLSREIERALRWIGCDVFRYEFDGRPEAGEDPYLYTPDQILYNYVESGFPVILGLRTEEQAHAAVIVGHTFEPDAWWPEAQEAYYPCLTPEMPWRNGSLWTPEFILHDDNFGPYLVVPKDTILSNAMFILVPVPLELNMNMEPGTVELYAALLLYDSGMIDLVSAEQNQCEWAANLSEVQRGRKVALRTVLTDASALMHHISTSSYSAVVKNIYEAANLPEHVWLVEISRGSMYPNKLKLGELIYDASCNPYDVVSGLEPVILMHTPGMVWLHPAGSKTLPVWVPDDRPTSLLCRPHYGEA